MSLKHAILGFLSSRSFSGYDLKKAFDNSVRHFWPANQSQIYRTLAELEAQGFVEKNIIPRAERLDMKVYNITESGRAELHRWLATPLAAPDYREPFLVQIYFSGLLSDAEINHLLHNEIQAMQERQAIYQSIYSTNQELIKNVENPRAPFLSLLTLEYGMLSNQAALDWLESVVERLRAKNYTLQDPNNL